MKRNCWQETDALDQRNSRIAVGAGRRFNIERGLRSLLLRLEELRLGRKAVVDAGLHRLLHRLRSFPCALAHQNFLASRPKLIKTFGYLKHDFLMSRVEANVRHHQLFSTRCDDGAAFAEIEQQPFRVQFAAIDLSFGHQRAAAGNSHVRKTRMCRING